MLYAYLLDEHLKSPVIREAMTELYPEFYASERYAAFSGRVASIRLGAASRHIAKDVSPTTIITRFGEHPFVRTAKLLDPFVGTLASYLTTAATEGVTKGSDTVTALKSGLTQGPTFNQRLGSTSAIFEFMREFMLNTGTEEDWTLMVNMMGEMGFERPAPADVIDHLNPPVIMSDGWTSSDAVTYSRAVASLAITPLFMRSGSPEKFAIVADKTVATRPEIVGQESPVSTVHEVTRSLTRKERDGFAKHGLFALDGKTMPAMGPGYTMMGQYTDRRPVMWVLRQAEQQAFLGDDLRFAIRGRFPMSMYNGDLDATPIQHTTFEAFAFDLGMSPVTLARLLEGQNIDGPDATTDDEKLRMWEFLKLFFTTASKEDRPSIFQGSHTYQLDKKLQFSAPMYFVSARSTALMDGSLVMLAPMAPTQGVSVYTRDLLSTSSRIARSFALVVADRQDPMIHSSALRETCQMDKEIAALWGVKLKA